MTVRGILASVRQCQSGIILPLVLVFLALGLLLLTPALGHGYSALAGTSVTETKAKELHAADAGIELGIHSIPHNYWEQPNSFELNDCDVDVVVVKTERTADDGKPVYHIQSIAESANDSRTVVDAYVSGSVFSSVTYEDIVSGRSGNVTNIEFDGDYIVDFDLNNIAGNTVITYGSTVVFMGYVSKFTGGAESLGTAIFCGGLGEFTGSTSSVFKLVVVGDLTLSGASQLNGETIVFGDVDTKGGQTKAVSGVLCVTGTISADINVSNADVENCAECCGAPSAYCLIGTSDFEVHYYEIE